MFNLAGTLALINANKHAAEGEIGVACNLYLYAYSLDSSLREGTEENFTLLFRKWCKQLEEKKRYRALFQCYEEAVTVLPDSAFILNDFGSFLLKYGEVDKAASYFRECLSVDEHFLRAVRNLDNILIMQVERWHFKMLNDQNRNEAFQEAITKKIKKGFDRVLDVGTGTGLLSLFSLAGGAKEVYACDASPTMIQITRGVLLLNKSTDVKLIQKHSTSLQIPEDIGEKVSLLVTETFDVGLLGEGILSTLTHAWEHLLLPPQPRNEVLDPVKFGMVVPYKAVVYVTGTQFDKVANDFHLKRTSNSCLFVDWNVSQSCDDYDSQDLSRVGCKFLTETEKAFEVNFNDPDALLEFSKGWNKDVTLKCKSPGRLDCFAVWFDLHLDEDIVLSTSPSAEGNIAWDQAVFLLPRSVLVVEEQDIKTVVSFEASKLKITLSDNDIDEPNFVASEDVIKMLNNEKLAEELHGVVNELAPAYNDPVSILDCYPFPVFGLNFLRNRSDRFKDELICFVPTEGDQQLARSMAEKYGVEIDALIKKEADFPTDYLANKKFDIVLLDLIKMDGEIRDDVLLLLDFLKLLLKPGGIILPERVTVIGQFVYSDWLDKVWAVSGDSVTCGYKIAQSINEYRVMHFIDFDYKPTDDIARSEPFELFDLLNRSMTTGKSPVPLESLNAKEVDSHSSVGFVNAMVYWFKIRFLEKSEGILTLDDPFCRQAARLFRKTEIRGPILFVIIRSDGLFDVNLVMLV